MVASREAKDMTAAISDFSNMSIIMAGFLLTQATATVMPNVRWKNFRELLAKRTAPIAHRRRFGCQD